MAPTQRALLVTGKGKYSHSSSYPMPSTVGDSEVVIRTHAVGLNHIDWMSVDYNFCLPEFPWVTGRETAGEIVTVGDPSVTKFKVGDRVWTSTYYRDRRAGCFQDYVVVPEHTVTRIPENMSFEAAACLGVCGLTAAMTLWKWLDVDVALPSTPSPPPSPGGEEYILIWAASSVTGQFAVQLAKQCGLNVIAVTSEKNKPLISKLGAHHVVVRDGRRPEELVEEVRELGRNRITRGIDLAGPETANLTIRCLSTDRRALFAPVALMAPNQIIPKNVVVRNIEMKQFVLDPSAGAYAKLLTHAVASGKIRLPAVEVLQGGLAVVPEGLDRLKRGVTHGRKLVVSMR